MNVTQKTWFEKLFEFSEFDLAGECQVPKLLRLVANNDDQYFLLNRVNNKLYPIGNLTTPTVGELALEFKHLDPIGDIRPVLKLWNIQGEITALHLDPNNAGAVFQVASQFNLLEMADPKVTPQHGVTIYERDLTQGPACAIVCGVGTAYRNYFTNNSSTNQINTIDKLLEVLDATDITKIENGYLIANGQALERISTNIASLSKAQKYEYALKQLRVGIHTGAEVIDYFAPNVQTGRFVNQVYCSAVPITYNDAEPEEWEPLARMILRGAYEATFTFAALNYYKTGNPKLYLTLLGGGVFGNKREWIIDAIARSAYRFRKVPLEVVIVSRFTPGEDLVTLER